MENYLNIHFASSRARTERTARNTLSNITAQVGRQSRIHALENLVLLERGFLVAGLYVGHTEIVIGVSVVRLETYLLAVLINRVVKAVLQKVSSAQAVMRFG